MPSSLAAGSRAASLLSICRRSSSLPRPASPRGRHPVSSRRRASVPRSAARAAVSLARPLRIATPIDRGRLRRSCASAGQALGIAIAVAVAARRAGTAGDVTLRGTERYTLRVGDRGIASRRTGGRRVRCTRDAGAAAAQRGARGWDLPCVAIDDASGAALAHRFGRRLARTAPDDALFQGAHPHARGVQGQRLLAVHGARLRRSALSVRRVARSAHRRRAARARRVRTAFSRRADPGAADLRAHARDARSGSVTRLSPSCRTATCSRPTAPSAYAYLRPLLDAELRRRPAERRSFTSEADEPLDLGRGRTRRSSSGKAAAR